MGIWIRAYNFVGGDVCVDVEFTTGRQVGDPPVDETQTKQYCRPITMVVGYTDAQIRGWLVTQVQNERQLILQVDVQALLGPLVDVDIEVP